MQWRFKTSKFIASLKIAARVPLTPGLERAQTPRWTAPLTAARKQAFELNAAGAAQLLANLPNAEEPDNPRAVLLFYSARKGASDAGAAQARRDLILWLVRVYPQDPILSSSYATVGASDAEATSSIKQAWLNVVKEYPQDDLVIQGAAHFLRLSDPMAAIKPVAAHHWKGQANWLRAVAATGALGVNGVSPENGAAISSSPGSVDTSLREAIVKSPDLKVRIGGKTRLRLFAVRDDWRSGCLEARNGIAECGICEGAQFARRETAFGGRLQRVDELRRPWNTANWFGENGHVCTCLRRGYAWVARTWERISDGILL